MHLVWLDALTMPVNNQTNIFLKVHSQVTEDNFCQLKAL